MKSNVYERWLTRDRIILFFVLFIAAGLFRLNSGWGLPHLLHPDEPIVISNALQNAINNTFEPTAPHAFYRPDHLTIKLSIIAYKIAAFINMQTVGEWSNGNHKPMLTTRIIIAAFALGSVFLAWLIGGRHNKKTGLIAASLFAFFPPYITHAHYATPEMPNVFCILLFIYFALRYHKSRDIKYLFLMSLAVALYAIEKYPGFLLCFSIAISVIYCALPATGHAVLHIAKHGSLAFIFVFCSAFILSPILFINFNTVLASIKFIAAHSHSGANGLPPLAMPCIM